MMNNQNEKGETMEIEIYKCEICGNIVQKLHDGGGELICCGEEMQKLEPKHNEESITEKHVPIFIKTDEQNTEIRVGEILHPMTQEHHIEFIEAINNDENLLMIKFLNPNDEPKMHINNTDYKTALEYCNIHGLWEGYNND